LLEEEGDALIATAVSQVDDPLFIDTAMAGAGLTAGDQPINTIEI
jgi:hypothetical protein